MIAPIAPKELARFAAPTEWPALTAEEAASHGADLTLVLPDAGALLRARCSLWWTDVPPLAGEVLGVIGHFGARDERSARQVLDAACAELASRGCTLAVGPMDGNTWRRHRFVVDRGTEPPFFLEPWNPPEWPQWWTASRFGVLAHYFSAANDDLTRRDERSAEVAPRLAANGVRIRTVDRDRFEEELAAIYSVARVAFQHNFLYTPIAFEQFAEQYRRILPVLVPELAFIAEHGERTVGFSFSIPDLAEQQRGASVRSVIVKTLAILPERSLLGGLGTLLVQRTREAARALGLTREIHALMHETNQSGNISARTARPIRRYALLARRLAPTGAA
jgi:GNAT superfamily N-acetyltransferase